MNYCLKIYDGSRAKPWKSKKSNHRSGQSLWEITLFTLALHSDLLHFFVAENFAFFVSNPRKMNRSFYFTFKTSFKISCVIIPWRKHEKGTVEKKKQASSTFLFYKKGGNDLKRFFFPIRFL